MASFVGTPKVHAGSEIGADIYCVMRQGGNNHESSWRASYESIKKEKSGFFKTSPRQAAAIIVEAVIRNPDKYDKCINYLGDLYRKPINTELDTNDLETKDESEKGFIEDRYGY